MNFNLRKTIEKSVPVDEFHFYIEELTSDNCMPTYLGCADEKYMYDEMDVEFFDFINRKSSQNGIYIRLIQVFNHSLNNNDVIEYYDNSDNNIITLGLESKDFVKDFKTNSIDVNLINEFADYGIKVQNNKIKFGTTKVSDLDEIPYFVELGSNEDTFSLDNPLNKLLIKLMKNLIVIE